MDWHLPTHAGSIFATTCGGGGHCGGREVGHSDAWSELCSSCVATPNISDRAWRLA